MRKQLISIVLFILFCQGQYAKDKIRVADQIHPNSAGAHIVCKELTGRETSHQQQAFPGVKTQWNGYDRYDFPFEEREAIIVVPKQAAKGNPWIWRPAFFDAFPSVDKALLEKGFHVVYYDVTHCWSIRAS